MLIALAGFLLAILSGLFGTPVGSRNFGIVFVWIAWWAILMLVAVPLLGRGWCSICPIPAPGEWLQRGRLLEPRQEFHHGEKNKKNSVFSARPGTAGRAGALSVVKPLNRRWPKRLRNIWLQNGTFLLVALFSTVILTQPRVTAIVLAAFLFVAIGASLVFERRAFCRYLCPVGGFIGLYSQLAPVEVRVIDTAVCAAHTEKTCYTGSAEGYGCPWDVFPPGMVKNTYCGACMECLRTCPHDNIAINIRSFGADLEVDHHRNPGHSVRGRLDETYKAFIMLGAAMVYSDGVARPLGITQNGSLLGRDTALAGLRRIIPDPDPACAPRPVLADSLVSVNAYPVLHSLQENCSSPNRIPSSLSDWPPGSHSACRSSLPISPTC